MPGYRKLFRLFLTDANDAAREVDEEIRAHLEMRAADLERMGMSPKDARAEAERRFGDPDSAREIVRGAARSRAGRRRRREWFLSVLADVKLATRRARKAPAQTAITVTIFALAVGLTTAGFTVVDRVLIRALPFPGADRLIALQSADSLGEPVTYLSADTWLDWNENNRTLVSSALYSAMPERWGLTSDTGAFNVMGRLATVDFFSVLGVRMVSGRGFRVEDAETGVTVVSESFWRRHLGGGSLPIHVDLAGTRREVIGIVPEGLEFPPGTEAYRLLSPVKRGGESYNWVNYFGIGRLTQDASLSQASDDLAAIARAAREQNPQGQYLFGAEPVPLQEMVVTDVETYLLLLMGAVLLLLLIACSNIAGLGLARASVRGEEVAVRLALGAGRARLVRQFITEHLVLALVGGVIGSALAIFATHAVATAASRHLPRANEIAVDTRVLLFALIVSLGAGLLAGVVPAFWASRTSIRGRIGGGRGAIRGGRTIPGAVLVGVEVALTLVLLTGGTLLISSFARLVNRDLGFNVSGVVIADATLGGRYEQDRWGPFWPQVEEHLRQQPELAAYGFSNAVPTGIGGSGWIEVEGLADLRAGADYRVVSDSYFDAIGIQLLAGRPFTREDQAGTERVTVINQAMADRYWPNGNPIGKRVKAYSMEGSNGTPETAPWLTVIGVVRNIRHSGHAGDNRPEMYVSMRQVPHQWHLSAMTAVVRGRPGVSDAALIEGALAAFRAQDPRLAVEVTTIAERLAEQLAERRLILFVLTGFATLSLLLAAIGLYGLLSFAVAQNWREMGIRAALGAGRAGIMQLILGRAFRIVALGTAAGVVLAFWLTKLMESMLVDVAPRDAASFASAIVVLVAVAAAASIVPALRATRVDPVEALRA